MRRRAGARSPITDDSSLSSAPSSSASSRSAGSSWFPPVTQQLRLRGLKAISFVASNQSRRGHSQGKFRITLHSDFDTDPFWTSPWWSWSKERLQDRLRWTDVELDKTKVHPGIQCLVARVWFCPTTPAASDGPLVAGTIHQSQKQAEGDPSLEVTWGVHLSGLECLGPHPPAHGRLPADAIVFIMSGYYFTARSAESRRGLTKHLFIKAPLAGGGGKGERVPLLALATKSYDTGLVLRLHRMQRALHQIDTSNSRLKAELRNRGVIDEEEVGRRVAADDPAPPRVLREKDFFNKRPVKSCRSRVTETHLQLQLESLQVRLDLLRREAADKRALVEGRRADAASVSDSNAQRAEGLRERRRVVCTDRRAYEGWSREFATTSKQSHVRMAALKDIRLNLVRGLSELYPVSTAAAAGVAATIRWVSVPDAGKALRDHAAKNEADASVAVTWLAHLVHLVGAQLGLPLRYPLRLQGSTSMVVDLSKDPPDEYPLFIKGSNNEQSDRFEMGVFLLSKDIAQLRWHFGRHTKDLKPMLKNVSELMSMGKHNEEVDRIFMLLPRSPQLALPPSSSTLGGKEGINGRQVEVEGLEIGVEATESKLSELMMSNIKLDTSAVDGVGDNRKGIKSSFKSSPARSLSKKAFSN